MQIIGIWIIFDHFWAIPEPKSQIWGSRFWPIFFLQNIGMWGVQSDARSFCDLFKWKGPTQRLKTAKKSFLRPLWTPNPNFWYLIFGQFFFLFNMILDVWQIALNKEF